MFALDAATGDILFSFASGGSVGSGAAVVNGTVYWGSGYGVFGPFFPYTGNNVLYAFEVP
jgi:polyvinyl alcohol dehydrogenase (cytochrome)